ncbi:DUF6471 domain-containing protein [Oxalobacteraceae bacterium OTU3CINTB1]|nr:DUF6471 domain-containing protein [Oxalobacteraceae bacterium OTU3CINTB1]
MLSTWETDAKRILKAELVLNDVSYKQLAIRLKELGVEDSHTAIANRISRGKFTFAFFLMCMRALGVKEVKIQVETGSSSAG